MSTTEASLTNPPMVISLLMPTRGRPSLAIRFFESVAKRSRYPDQLEIILYIDDDDVESHNLSYPGLRIHKIIGEKLTMGGYNTACLNRSSGEIIGLVNDDVVIQTEDWDERVRDVHRKYSDGIYLAYGNDLFKREKMCAFPILSKRTCELLGDPYPLAYRGAFIDNELMDVFRRMQFAGYDRICYLDEVIFEHFHYRVKKASMDETYQKRQRFGDDGVFLGLQQVRVKKAQKLINTIKGLDSEAIEQGCLTPVRPQNPFSALFIYSKQILLDSGLPLQTRIKSWFWFYGRFLAVQGWLRPFVSPPLSENNKPDEPRRKS